MPRLQTSFLQLADGLLLITVGFLAALSKAQSDTWWHLRAGEQIVRDHDIPQQDTWSWTANGRTWPDHEWLWQAAAYGLHAVGGLPLLAAANAALALLAVILIRRTETPPTLTGTVLTALALPMVTSAWAIRPQVMSIFFFVVMLRLLASGKLWWIPPLFLLWANVHGAVATGGFALAVVTTWALVRRWDNAPALVLTTLMAALATLLTPLGLGLWWYVLESPQRSRAIGLEEWASAFSLSVLSVAFWIWLFGILALAYRRSERLMQSGVVVYAAATVATALLSAIAVRNIAFFTLASLPVLFALLSPRAPGNKSMVRFGRPMLVGAGSAAALVSTLAWFDPPAIDAAPISASVRQSIERCPGRLFNTYEAGGPILWRTGGKVFVDSRQDPYPRRVLDDARRIEQTADVDLLDQYDVNCAVVAGGSRLSAALADAGWTLMGEGHKWTVYARDGLMPTPRSAPPAK